MPDIQDIILQKLEEIKSTLLNNPNLRVAADQVTVMSGLSDISKQLGLILSGEFRAGNGQQIGDGFSGVRMAYPPFEYGSEEWHLAGIFNDILQFALSAEDGKAKFGGGAVELSAGGIALYNGATQVGKWDSDGDFATGEDIATPSKSALQIFTNAQTYNSESMGAGDLLIGDNSSGKPNLFWDASVPELYFRHGTDIVGRLSSTSVFSSPQVAVVRSTDFTLTSGLYVTMTPETELYDNADIWEGVTNPERFSIPQDGIYALSGVVHFDTNANGARFIGFRTNGGTPNALVTVAAVPLSDYTRATFYYEIGLSDLNYLEFVLLQNSGVDVDCLYFQVNIRRVH